ncbi:MAG: DUF6443 domain-containing protein [Bacteroidales bacterium]|jgi:RHS repeat-associated protein|nr:DUF6443 domain-containing protein [Bacteroidales bacterium]
MKRYLIFVFIIVLLAVFGDVCAQIPRAPASALSPNAASLGQYGDIPVSHYTGVPEITIPLYELKVKNFVLPITLSYHAAGVQVDQRAGWTGVNWTLFAGGVIMRRVNGGKQDEHDNSVDGYGGKKGFYFNHNVLSTPLWNKREHILNIASIARERVRDLAPDEFSFCFANYNGKFYLDHNGNWIVQCDKPVKVEFDGTFLEIPFRAPEVAYHKYSPCFGGFSIITEDGTKYVFGKDINAVDFSIDFFAQKEKEWIATAWYLTKIILPNKYEINLIYERNEFINQMYIFVYDRVGISLPDGHGGFLDIPCSPTSNGKMYDNEGNLLSPVYLKKIISDDIVISFHKSISNELEYDKKIYDERYDELTDHYDKALFLPFLKSNIDGYPACLKQLKWYKLDSIVIQNITNSECLKNIKFSYNNSDNERLFLDSVTEYNDKSYIFSYNQRGELPEYLENKSDHWGYFNKRIAYYDYHNYYNYREPNATAMKYGILTKITYPTGGYTEFEFEPHDYRKQTSVERWKPLEILSENKIAGGLRIKRLKNSCAESGIADVIKEYYYLQNGVNSVVSSGILGGQIRYYFDDYVVSSFHNENVKMKVRVFSSVSVLPSCQNVSGSHIGYTNVVEKNADNSFTQYKFTNFDNGHMDESADTVIQEAQTPYGTYASKKQERGKLLSVEYYNSNNIKVKSKYFSYERDVVYNDYVRAMEIRMEQPCGTELYVEGSAYRIYTYLLRLKSETETCYDPHTNNAMQTQTTDYTYNYKKLLRSISRKNSDNRTHKTEYKYCFDFSGNSTLYRMDYTNILSPLVEQSKYIDGSFVQSERIEYDFNSNGVCVPKKVFTKKGNNSEELRLSFSNYDKYGNSRYVIKNGVENSVYLWGNKGRNVVAEIRNATYEQVKTKTGGENILDRIADDIVLSRSDLTLLDNLRVKLPNAQIITNNYKLDAGLSSQKDPRGIATFYDYDAHQRLSAIKDNDNSKINTFSYTYGNGNDIQNSIKTLTMTDKNGSSKPMETINYYDGLGRLMEQVFCGITSSRYDLITYQKYDVLGRPAEQYLPHPFGGNKGSFVNFSTFKSRLSKTASHNYTFPVYENSPLNRVVEQYGAGTDWHISEKSIKTAYSTNTSTDCRYYEVAGNDLQKMGNYSVGELYVTKTTDEDGNISYEYKDKSGSVILQRQVSNGENHDTYYVYDNYGNKCFVIPPLAADALKNDAAYNGTTHTALKNLCYTYRYDHRNRCIYKRLPGAEPIYYIYDKADRLILSQDGEQRTQGVWLYTIPDVFGRVCITGTCKNSFNYTADPLKNIMVTAQKKPLILDNYDYSAPFFIYDVNGIAPNTPTTLSVNYYDNYGNGGPAAAVKYDNLYNYDEDYTANAKTLPTGTVTAVMDENGKVSSYLYGSMYYSNKGRLIQRNSTNAVGGYDKEYYAYNFIGNVLRKKHIHTSKYIPDGIEEEYFYDYDHAQRLIQIEYVYNNKSGIYLSTSTYDETGRLKTTIFAGNIRLQREYLYNVRSQLTNIKGIMFDEKLYYNDAPNGNACWNGNISAITYNDYLHFDYLYDGLNRLVQSKNNYYGSNYRYDKNGNITRMFLYDGTAGEYRNFKYVGNRDVNNEYNVNGSITLNAHNNSYCYYNLLGLPRMVEVPELYGTIAYSYDAFGNKLSANYRWRTLLSFSPKAEILSNMGITVPSISTKQVEYASNLIYEDGKLKMLRLDGGDGYISFDEKGNYDYNFYQKDHAGNIMLVTDRSGNIKQETYYYAYGEPIIDESSGGRVQPYKFGGKEQETLLGLTTLDFHARQLDCFSGRFLSIDPLCEKYYSVSPYVYCLGNPVKFIDQTGMDVWLTGSQAQSAFQQLQARFEDKLLFLMNKDGKISYEANGKLKGEAKRLARIIDDNSVNVNLKTTNKTTTSTDQLFIGGAFMGNEISADGTITANQEINPAVLGCADEFTQTPGKMIMHELTEAYEGAKISQKLGISVGRATQIDVDNPNSIYNRAHNKATSQTPVYQTVYDKNGRVTTGITQPVRVEWSVIKGIKSKVIQTLP